MRELKVVGLRVELPSNTPVLVLREVDGERVLPIWIGAVEATAIAVATQGLVPQRPLTHDLLAQVIEATGHALVSVSITRLEEGTFYAELELTGGVRISARPSDAVALALRVPCPIMCNEAVLDVAGTHAEHGVSSGMAAGAGSEEATVEEFREFLDQIEPEDFG